MERKPKPIFDVALLIILTILIGYVFYYDVDNSMSFSANDILAILILVFSLRLFFFSSSWGQKVLCVLLLVSMINVLNFGTNYSLEDGRASWSLVNAFGLHFNPYCFFLLLLFSLINRKNLMALYLKMRYGTAKEQEVEMESKVKFYYDKFIKFSAEELEVVFKDFKEYPEEAQIAIDKIKKEKGIL